MSCEWISVDDYLPEIGKCVIAYDPDLWSKSSSGMFAGADNNVGEWYGFYWRVAGSPANVTHWMPFPPSPTEGK